MPLQLARFLRALSAAGLFTAAITVVAAQASFAATIQDQNNPGPRVGYVSVRETTFFAQTFRAGITGQLNRISLMGCDGEDRLQSVTVRIYSAVSTPPNSTPPMSPASALGEAHISGAGLTAIPAKSSGCMTAFDVTLDSPAPVTVGNLYVFVVSATLTGAPVSVDDGLVLQSSDISTYADGNRSRSLDSGASWTAAPTRNIIFTTYVDVGSPSPLPVLQQFGKPVVGLCADEAPKHTQLPGAPTGGWSESWAQWMNDGKGGAVCTRTLIYSPRGMWVVE